MFACAHPALDRQSLLALTLRLVSGVGLRRDRSALLQTDTVVGQRITGVKKQDSAHQHPIAGAPVELLPQRMPNALSCIYSVFAEGY